MAITDRNGNIIRVNPEFEKSFGWKEDEIKGVFLDDIIIESERKGVAILMAVSNFFKVSFRLIRTRKKAGRIKEKIF